MKRYPVLLLLLALASLPADATTEWSAHYHGEAQSLSMSYDAIEIPRGYLLATLTWIPEVGSRPAILQVGAAGDPKWAKYYDSPGLRAGTVLVPTPDGGAVMSGVHQAAEVGSLWLMRIDASGAPVWSKTYGPAWSGRILPAHGGGFFLLGSFLSDASSTAPWVARLDANGSIVWQAYYPIQGNPYVSDLDELPGGDLLVTGSTFVAGHDQELWVMRLHGDGTVVWVATYGGPAGEYATATLMSRDGRAFIAGDTRFPRQSTPNKVHPGAIVLELSPDGAIVGQWAVRGKPVTFLGSAALSARGNVILAGNERASGGKLWAAEIDPAGTIVWARSYGRASFSARVRRASDGGALLTASSSKNLHPPRLLKLDPAGRVPGEDCTLDLQVVPSSFERHAAVVESVSTDIEPITFDVRARDVGSVLRQTTTVTCHVPPGARVGRATSVRSLRLGERSRRHRDSSQTADEPEEILERRPDERPRETRAVGRTPAPPERTGDAPAALRRRLIDWDLLRESLVRGFCLDGSPDDHVEHRLDREACWPIYGSGADTQLNEIVDAVHAEVTDAGLDSAIVPEPESEPTALGNLAWPVEVSLHRAERFLEAESYRRIVLSRVYASLARAGIDCWGCPELPTD